MKNIIKVMMFMYATYLYSFEVNTHQAITRCALTQECSSQGGVSNLENFVRHVELNTTLAIYDDELFDKYGETYKKYVRKKDTGFKDWNISITPNYHGMIEAGSVLEDAVYYNQDPSPLYSDSLYGADGRFNNHFYAVQINTRATALGFIAASHGLMGTTHTLSFGYGKRTDNIDWVFNKNVELGLGRVNDYGLEDAFDYFKKSFEGNETERTKYQAKFFVTLGMMSHMLQDLHSPAHVRDGGHPLGAYLEMYGRYDKGFNLKNGHLNPKNEPEITSAIHDFDISSYVSGMNFKSLEDFYYKEASWVSFNFFSEAHNSKENSNTQTGAGNKINNVQDADTIFDGNPHLSKDETHEEETADDNWNYIKTDGNSRADDIYGDIVPNHDTVAFVEHGLFFNSEHMLVPTKYKIKRNALNEPIELEPSDPINEYDTADTTALKDTAINVIPRAVASTQSFLNFFFRGQIAASTIYGRRIYVFNDSNTSVGIPPELLKFKAGAKIYFYYMNEDDNISHSICLDTESKPMPYILENDVEVGSYTSFGFNENDCANKVDGDVFKGADELSGRTATIDAQDTQWMVVYDGDIGDDTGGSNTYGYGMRAVTADIAKKRFKRIVRDGDNNTVIDYQRNVEWQDTSYTWQDAHLGSSRYCSNLELGGYDDWSLPTIEDLQSIIRPMSYDFEGDPLRTGEHKYVYRKYFKHLGDVGYWGGPFYDNYPATPRFTAGGIYYGDGSYFVFDWAAHMNTRCVRSIY